MHDLTITDISELPESSLWVLPIGGWEGFLNGVMAQVHPADWWAPSDLAAGPTRDEVRQLVHRLALSPVGKYLVVALTAADRWRPEIANSFLKILEEPHATTRIVVLTESERLLPTVRSRLQLVHRAEEGVTSWWSQTVRSLPPDSDGAVAAQYATHLVHATINERAVRPAFSHGS
jgi:hypothetical protein